MAGDKVAPEVIVPRNSALLVLHLRRTSHSDVKPFLTSNDEDVNYPPPIVHHVRVGGDLIFAGHYCRLYCGILCHAQVSLS